MRSPSDGEVRIVCILELRMPLARRFHFTTTLFLMKNTLLALAMFAFAGTTAFAQQGQAKADKKDKQEACAMKGSMAGGSSCCMKGGKVAAAKPAAKPAVATIK